MRRKRIYVSGAISGLDEQEYMQRFANAEAKLKAQGYIVVNPARVLAQLPKETEYNEYIKISCVMLDMCDVIYMLDGWQSSTGACLEKHYAEVMGKGVVYEK